MRCKLKLLYTSAHSGKSFHVCVREGCGRSVECRESNPDRVGMTCHAPQTICAHALPQLLRLQRCDSCPGNVQVKVFACALLGERTLAKDLPGVPCCDRCERREPC